MVTPPLDQVSPPATGQAPNGWSDLVTTALLGTDRRPVPADLDLGWGVVEAAGSSTEVTSTVLGLAAAHQSLSRAGMPLPHEAAPPEAPRERLPLASLPAQELLAGLLRQPDPGLLNTWLSRCAERGLGVAAEQWPRLAAVATRHPACDRTLLVRTLGPRGRWFLSQNPAWGRLAEPAVVASTSTAPEDPAAALTYAEHGESATRAVELILACPDPLSTVVVQAALRLVAGGALGADTRKAAAELAYRIPLSAWSELADWVAQDGSFRHPGPASMARTVQSSLDLIERTVRARIEIDDIFTVSSEEDTARD